MSTAVSSLISVYERVWFKTSLAGEDFLSLTVLAKLIGVIFLAEKL